MKKLENLDHMDVDDLSAFIDKHRNDPRYALEVDYAQATRSAQDARRIGNINSALRFEREADKIYDKLPAQEQW